MCALILPSQNEMTNKLCLERKGNNYRSTVGERERESEKSFSEKLQQKNLDMLNFKQNHQYELHGHFIVNIFIKRAEIK